MHDHTGMGPFQPCSSYDGFSRNTRISLIQIIPSRELSFHIRGIVYL